MLFNYLINDYFVLDEIDTPIQESKNYITNNDDVYKNNNLFITNYIMSYLLNNNPNIKNLKMMTNGKIFHEYIEKQFKKPEPGLHLIVGPMKVGKTKYLVEVCENNKNNFKTLFVNNSLEKERLKMNIQNKLNEVKTVKCHDQDRKLSDEIDIIYNPSITEIQTLIKNYDLIVINEAQFFEDIEILKSQFFTNKSFIIAGLDNNKYGEDFGYVKNLLKFSNRVDKFTGICEDCGKGKAILSKLKSSDNGSVIDIDVNDKYKIVCGKCFYEI